MLSETERLSLKVLQSDKAALQRLAATEGEAMSVVVRRLIRDAIKKRGLLPAPDADGRQAEGVTHEVSR